MEMVMSGTPYRVSAKETATLAIDATVTCSGQTEFRCFPFR
jgi:hypothetical protein